ncbi:PglZ domain-containing protein [Candidatus Poriferisodalis sp.]|uniref:PglZ domain-containing protein n=1 Tax=Candidatus Poriferisodalis sp. TaxID=3101277 RepID=UPI003B026099
MTELREQLRADLAAHVEQRGVVVWDDPEAAYAGVAADVVPEGTALQEFSGSWLELRHRLERHMAGQEPPALIVYVPTKPPDPDPLEEIRAVCRPYRRRLPTLLKHALKGQLTEQRITQIGRQCATFADAEAALDAGDRQVDARLISVLGETSTAALAAALICGTHEAALARRSLESACRQLITEAIGGSYDSLDDSEFRDAAFRQVVLGHLAEAGVGLPPDLNASVATTTPLQRRNCADIIEMLQVRMEFRAAYVELAEMADQQLHLGTLLTWAHELRTVDATPAIDLLGLDAAIRALEAGDEQVAVELASDRLSMSWWLRSSAPDAVSLVVKFRAVRALAQLGISIARPVPALRSLLDVRDWYQDEGWQVDSGYRQSELIRVSSGIVLDEFDELYHSARRRYEAWLDQILRDSADALSAPEIPTNDQQRSIHASFLRDQTMRTAYFLVDALRYELGMDLVERLGALNADVEHRAVVATPPTITPVGMAALLPNADTEFLVELDEGDRLVVSVGGSVVKSARDRVRQLEHAHGAITDLHLDDVAQLTNQELKKVLGDSSPVLVRSTEIDSDGESDQLAASWGSFDSTLGVLQTAVAKLFHAGVERVVIASDHGFLAVRQLGEERRIDKPSTGAGESHRRSWIGRGGTASQSMVKISLAAFGIAGGLEIITPRGLGVFATGGGLQFFHGGLSPQELVIPVIVATARDASDDPQYRIDLDVAGQRITTGVVAVTLMMTGNLFTRESRIRLQLVQDDNRVGAVVGGDGFDPATETIDASVDAARVITVQVTANLVAGSIATLEVSDAATGVRLETLNIAVGANVIVEDNLD